MIETNTVLILGAGASVDYEYPTGLQLRSLIIERTGHGHPIAAQLQILEHSEKEIAEFRRAFRQSSEPSIDSFLEKRPEFVEIGKQAIAAALIPYELEESLILQDKERWYHFLWRKLTEGGGHPGANALSVITFNYDRSLEHFLYTSLQNAFNFDDEEIARTLSHVVVVHLYGQLGVLPFQPGYQREYRPEIPAHIIRESAKQIRIVHEGERITEDLQFAWAAKLVAEAQQVCFLGFGYLPTNIQRLPLHKLDENAPIYGTAYGLGEGEASIAKQRLRKRTKRESDGLTILGGRGQDCLELLKQYAILI